MCEERLPCLQAATSHTLADVMYSFAHSILAQRVTCFSSWLCSRLSSGFVASRRVCVAVLHSSVHHRALKPGAVPLRFIVAAQALLNAAYMALTSAFMSPMVVIHEWGEGSSMSRIVCHSSQSSGSMSVSNWLVRSSFCRTRWVWGTAKVCMSM
jgi:hypothetical protein